MPNLGKMGGNHMSITAARAYLSERGYGDSVGLPGFGTENDELVY